MKTKSDSDNVSEFFLARWHTDQVTDEERELWDGDKELQAALEEREELLDDEVVKDSLDALLEQSEEWLTQAPVAFEPPPKQAEPKGWFGTLIASIERLPVWGWGGMVAAAAALVIVLWQPEAVTPPITVPGIKARPVTSFGTSKGARMGSWQILYARKDKNLSQFLRRGQTLHPGDRIQFSYTLVRSGVHVAIVSVNRRGMLSTYAPFRGTQSILLDTAKGTWPESSSLILDDALGQEWLIVAMSKKAFPLARLQAEIKAGFKRFREGRDKTLKLRGPWSVQLLSIEKTKTPPPSPDGQ